MTSLSVFSPRTISSRRITFAGLKKWCPMTCSGRDVTEAISSILRVDVFDANTAPGLAIASISPKIFFLRSMSSKTASMTMSASAKPS